MERRDRGILVRVVHPRGPDGVLMRRRDTFLEELNQVNVVAASHRRIEKMSWHTIHEGEPDEDGMEVSAARRVVRICFWAAVVAVFTMSLAPTPMVQSSIPSINDKVQHFTGFLF